MMRTVWKALVLAAFFAIRAIAGFAQDSAAAAPLEVPAYSLVVTDRNSAVLAEIPLPGGRFDLVFIHSFHLTPVAERFVVTVGAEGIPMLHLFELEYESNGTGMPSDAENGFRLVDGKFLLAMDRTFAVIPLMVSIVPGHGIIAGGSFRPFSDLVPPETMLFLAAKAVPKTSSPGGIDR